MITEDCKRDVVKKLMVNNKHTIKRQSNTKKGGGWVGSRRSKASARGKQKINNARNKQQAKKKEEIMTQLISSV